MSEVTRILSDLAQGDANAAAQLLPLVYDELRRLAAAQMAREKPGQTLNATALVHEAYVRLVGDDEDKQWDGRGHFFAAAAESMRRILIERARARATLKRGGDRQRIELDDVAAAVPDAQLLALDDALADLEKHDEAAARLVKLRYFVGLSHQDAALAMGLSRRAADRLWALARAWLFDQLRTD